ncbi:hypothetical protein LNQ81_06745 [Myroides sp. M-43]|uniref:lectin-like domain-containing protein n=1 Tax=Myroides oncorhynchi TaxID=2893756 RepID=UPI001E5CD93A|nr:hypothetical protein [Myroides oncorhynchi]MCC9042391.1 hypothetical protein [Myroides oncorhynchi]
MSERMLHILLVVVSVVLGVFSPVYAQFNIQESFSHRSVNSKVKLGDNALLTAANGTDSYGNGWLRLTSDAMKQKGYAIIDESFPSNRGVLIDFEYKTWRKKNGKINTGGDGISVFLFDAKYNAKTFKLGSYGGALGYGSGSGTNGVTGGYIAVGFDEFGNFVGLANNKPKGTDFSQNISIRGKIFNDVYSSASYLKHTTMPLRTTIDNFYTSPTRPDDFNYYRRAQIEMKPYNIEDPYRKNPDGTPFIHRFYTIKVRYQISLKGEMQEVLSYTYNELPYENLKIGFAASTGDAVNIHEIRNLNVTTPEGLVINKTVDLLEAKKGDKLTYTIEMSNHSSDLYKDFLLSDYLESIKDFFRVEEVSFDNLGNTKNTLTPPKEVTSMFMAKNIVNWKVSLDTHSSSRVIIRGTVIGYPGKGVLSNEASLNVTNLRLPYVDPTKLSAIAETKIIGKPHEATTIRVDHAVICEGDEAVLTAKEPVLGGLLKVDSYRWFRDGNLFKITEPNKILEGGKVIEELLPTNQIAVTEPGVYTVVYVFNGVSSDESNKVKVTTLPTPKLVLKNPTDSFTYNLNVGEAMVLPLVVIVNSTDKVQWYDHKGKEISDRTQPIIFNTPGVYNYTVVGANKNECSDVKTVQINVFDDSLCPPTYQREWATDYTAWYSALTGGVSNKGNAIDGRPDTYSTITVAVGLLGLGTTWQNLYFAEEQEPGTPVTIKLGKEYSGLVALGGLTVAGLDARGKVIGSLQGVDGGLVDLLSADNVVEYTFVPSNKKGPQKYLGVQVVLGSTLGVAQNAKVYGAYVNKAVDNPSCAPVLPNINPNVLDVLHGVEDIGLGVASATASVSHPWNAVDDNPDSYAVISRGVAVANMASLTVVFKQTAMPGDELHITAENKNPGILSLELVKGFKIQRYLGDKKVGDPLTESNGALRLRLLGIGGRDRYRIIVAPSKEPFDRVKISYGSVVGVLGDFTHIYNVDLVPTVDVGMQLEVDEYGYELEQVLQLCAGEPLRIKPQNNHCTTYEVYTSEKGGNRLPSLGDMFTVDLSKQYKVGEEFTVYVQANRNGCKIGTKTPIKIKINEMPSIVKVVTMDIKGKESIIGKEIRIKGGQQLQLLPTVIGEIQLYEWEYLFDSEREWKSLPFMTVDNPVVEVRKTIVERDAKGNVVFDKQGNLVIKQQGGVFITKVSTGIATVNFPKNAIVNGENWNQKKGKIRLTITNLAGCSTSQIYDLSFLKGYRDGIFSNPMLPSKKIE